MSVERSEARTMVDYRVRRRCDFGHWIPTGEPFKLLLRGKKVYLVCLQHYKVSA